MVERVLGECDLMQAEAVYVCNSVHGLRRVTRIDEQREADNAPTEIWSSNYVAGTGISPLNYRCD